MKALEMLLSKTALLKHSCEAGNSAGLLGGYMVAYINRPTESGSAGLLFFLFFLFFYMLN